MGFKIKPEDMESAMLPTEKHYTIRQLERRWNINYHTLRRWFQNEPGVINAANGKKNIAWRIPESVAERVYNKHVLKGRAA